MTFNITKRVGQVNEVIDHFGRRQVRRDKLLYTIGENNIQLVDVLYDPDHLIFQALMPITKEEYEQYRQAGKGIPKERLGNLCQCTCGSPAYLCIDPKAPKEWQSKLVCGAILQYGIHMTSFKIVDNKATLPESIAQDRLLLDSDLRRLYKNEDER